MEATCVPTTEQETVPVPERSLSETVGERPIQVLLVEDDPDAAHLARVRLTEESPQAFRLEWTSNLRQAMSRLAQPGIDVVLLDLGLPELSGHKSFRVVEFAAGDKIPVVILTADDTTASRELTLGFGACDYLIKQKTSPAELCQALQRAVLMGPRKHTFDS